MSTFTPGPWRLYSGHTAAHWIVQRRDEGGFVVQALTDERALADARLIASAPDMYEALKRIIETQPRVVEPWTHEAAANEYARIIDEYRTIVRGVIRKADGREG